MRNGTALDAVLVSLGANAEHGKRRDAGDYRKAYDIACRYKLVPPADSDAVAKLLRCSIRWARELTAEAREQERADEAAEMQRLRDEGLSNRQIAAEIGRGTRTVDRTLAAPKGNTTDLAQPGPDPFADAREMFSPRAQRWHGALEAPRRQRKSDPA